MAKKTVVTLDNLTQYNTLSKQYIKEKIEEEKVTKTSELTNDSNFAKTNENNNFSSSQTITGDLTVTGSITQQGESYDTHAEKVYTKNDFIILRDGATGGLADGEYAGFKATLYNGTRDGELVFDNQGTARVGDVDDEQPLLTRSEETDLEDGQVFVWDAANHKAVGSSEYSTNVYKKNEIDNKMQTKADGLSFDNNQLQLKSGDSLIGSPVDIEIQSNEVVISDEQPTEKDAKIWINNNEIFNKGSEVVNSLDGDETALAPSVHAVNNIKGKILWTNPNPANEFASQTVALSSDDYDMLEIFYYDYVGTNNMYSTKLIKGNSGNLMAMFQYHDHGYIGSRRVVYNSDTSYMFANGVTIVQLDSFNRAGTDGWCVPLYIIGYKTGLFN